VQENKVAQQRVGSDVTTRLNPSDTQIGAGDGHALFLTPDYPHIILNLTGSAIQRIVSVLSPQAPQKKDV